MIDGYVCPLLVTKPNPPFADLEHITYPLENFQVISWERVPNPLPYRPTEKPARLGFEYGTREKAHRQE